MPITRCKDCQLWDMLKSKTDGLCRKYAPRPTMEDVGQFPHWAITEKMQGCGEGEPRKKEGE